MATYNEPHLASAVVWWLNYVSAVGREYIVEERTLKIPVTEYLERFFRDNIVLEYDHPLLTQKKVDLYFKDVYNSRENAFEFKFVREDSTRALKERKRIFNDLMRLRLLLDKDTKGYFLICGSQIHFKSSFQNLDLHPKFPVRTSKKSLSKRLKSGYFGEWFSFNLAAPIRKINLNSKKHEYQEIYTAFIKDHTTAYRNSAAIVPIKSIKTKLIFLSEELMASNIPQTFKIGIWEVVL